MYKYSGKKRAPGRAPVDFSVNVKKMQGGSKKTAELHCNLRISVYNKIRDINVIYDPVIAGVYGQEDDSCFRNLR
ncbi:MAG: hypothetical protein K2P64_07630 [Lachnospiraceae bacterium]|nr:hypothetical protein [Lachnospiraceae bacterium]